MYEIVHHHHHDHPHPHDAASVFVAGGAQIVAAGKIIIPCRRVVEEPKVEIARSHSWH